MSAAVHPRAASEEAAHAVAKLGCRTLVMQMPQAHDALKQGLWSYAMQLAREKVSPHTSVKALIALEKGQAGAVYPAVAEEVLPCGI